MTEKEQKNLHAGYRANVKKRFAENGFQQFEDHQVLEYILFFAIPRRDTNEIAHRLIERFGSLKDVLEASPEELAKVEGVGEHASLLISSFLPVARRYGDAVAREKKDLPAYKEMGKLLMNRFAGLDHEQVYIVMYDLAFQRCGDFILQDGDLNHACFSLRTLGDKLLHSKGTYMILAHNHPGGLPIATDDDLECTERISRFVENMNVLLVDHFIIGDGSFSSTQKDCYYDLYYEFKHPVKK
ncbi:MAG: RadC family protein [Clostridia bacterium]|nr:RadC family protein [Clostridia bacterium]